MSSPCASTQASASCAVVQPFSSRHALDLADEIEVPLEILALEARVILAEIVLGESRPAT